MIIIESAYVTNRLQNGFRKNTWYSFLRGPKQHHYLSFFRIFLKNRMERSQDLFYQGLIYRSLMIGLSFWYIVIKIKGALNNFNFMHRLIRASSTLPFRPTYGHLTVVRARGEVNWQKALQGVEILNLAWVGWGIGARGFKSFQWNMRVLVLEMEGLKVKGSIFWADGCREKVLKKLSKIFEGMFKKESVHLS